MGHPRRGPSKVIVMVPSKTTQQARALGLIAGSNKHFTGVPSVTVGGVTYALPVLLALLQSFVDLLNSVITARGPYLEALKNETAKAPALRAIVSAFRAYVVATFGNSPQVLADFGIAPRKAPLPKTAQEKVIAVEKSAATRAARHTMGKRQKAKVKGTVPATAPAAAAAASPGPTGDAGIGKGSTGQERSAIAGSSPEGSGNGAPPHA